MRSNKIAFLAYYPLNQRSKNNSFEGNYNIGANVIMDVMRRNDIECDMCTPDTAKNYEIVLISLTSDYDCIALYKAVALLPSWQPGRKFKVVAGGAGMQNPTVIRRYIDYAVFGRGENIIYQLVDAILGGNSFEHGSVMSLPDIYPVKLAKCPSYIHTKLTLETVGDAGNGKNPLSAVRISVYSVIIRGRVKELAMVIHIIRVT